MRKLVLAVGILLLTGLVLPACSSSRDEVESLRRQVADQQSQIDALQSTAQSLGAKVASIHGLKECLGEVRDLVAAFGQSSTYLSSGRVIGPIAHPFHSSVCTGVMTAKAVEALSRNAKTMNQALARAEAQRFDAWITPTSPSSGSTSGVTAICNDGTYSYSQHASGTCSWHGGVGSWINYPGN